MAKSSRLGLLRNRDFGRLFAATALGQLGDRIIFLALPLVAIAALHADEFQVGLLTAMTSAGSLLVGLPAGAWVDRMRKRSVMINTDLARALFLLTIPVAWWADLLTIWWLYAVALVHGVLTVFFDVAYISYLPHLVGRSNLVEGNSKLSAIRSVTSISGPTVAGPLVGLVGAPATLLVSSAGMAMSGLLAITIRKREEKPEPSEHPQLAREIKEGLKFVVKYPTLRAIMLGDAIFNLFLVMYQTMLLVFLEREIGLQSFGLGLIFSGMGCGALLGALLATRVSKRVGHGPVIWLASLVSCPLTALMPLARAGWSVYVAAIGLAALSLGGVVRVVAQSSFQQALTPDRLLGRMSATARFVSWGGIPLGGLLGGASGSVFGAAGTLWIGAAGMTLSFLPNFLSPLRTMRTLPTEKAPEFAR
ncbi:MFS transporter [Streptomyces sp. NBC_00264]|uniref:MFS transporter n=1 Tax=unclassified Streptomyces TaxID=2593676 RepID=UPI000F5BCC96|nr:MULTISPECIES: MFS transporter [unclassified Streptomyces]WSG48389.1 MFS transporter [Streptomyces sp. NBC_01732]WSW99038.1 MFS transporter [Streptomyces sp. NBC_00987]MCX5166330.1 MFS transporter [Streptomyces sp. NBC_00305]MCX5224847.1 MFS transporter [Streptomyces sp. NBC_00264]RPK54040.1 enterobactin exporter EntS [Streptomyces sp. ADI95-17]